MQSHIIAAILLLLVFAQACKQEPIAPVDTRQEIATARLTGFGLDLHLWSATSDDTLYTGYQPLSFTLTAAGETTPLHATTLYQDYQITVQPLMHMPTMKHSAPVEQATAADTDGHYPFAVVFTMPGDAMSRWELIVKVRRGSDGMEEEVVLPVSVADPTLACLRKLVAADDSSKIFVSLVAPAAPAVGINPFEVAVHYKASMMRFPALEGITVEIEPEMPSMGHGSPNNVHPTHTREGHYAGRVNFTMDGEWLIHVRLFRGGVAIGETDFTIVFQVR
ncbi:MAG: hypothetical protein OHK0039_21330 [Bacteroidia bacterium]